MEMIKRISITKKYLAKMQFKNLALVIGVFTLLFALIDSVNFNTSSELGVKVSISILRSIINLDTLFSFIATIATMITLLKLKQTNQDIALISLDKNPCYIFNIFVLCAVIIYIFFIIIIHPLAFFGIKYFENKNFQNQCIHNSSGQYLQNDNIIVNSIQYSNCNNNTKSLEEFEVIINNKTSIINIIIYNSLITNHNKTNAIIYDSEKDNISFIKKNIQNEDEINYINKIDEYKKDLQNKQISLYHMLYSVMRDKNGIISVSDIVDMIFYKIKNILLIIVFLNACYFILIANKRGRKCTATLIKTLIFIQIYYIITYLISEKLLYADAILIKIIGFIAIHIFIILLFKHIQYQCFLSMQELYKEIYTYLRGKKILI